MNRTRVKICGITRSEDALAAVEAGADAIGLVFWSGSKRAVEMTSARKISALIPPSVSVVGVFVNASVDEVCQAAEETGITVAQLCGQLGSGNWAQLPRAPRILRAVPVSGERGPDSTMRMNGVGDYLVDNGSAGCHGGTGETFDWSLADSVRSWGRIWLAGGLNPQNVRDAIALVRPHAVDVSSGVEAVPGIKSPDLIRAFIDAVHHADHAIAKADPHAH